MLLRLRSAALTLALCFFASASQAEAVQGRPVDRDGNPGHPQPASYEATPSLRADSVEVFFDQSSFLAAAGVSVTQTFEDLAADTLCDGGAQSEIVFVDFVATATPPSLKVMRESCFGNHNTTPGGRKYLSADTDSAGLSAEVTFTFPESLAAFGLFIADLDVATLQVRVNDTDYPVLPNGDGGESYFGIVSPTPFVSVSLRITDGTDTHYSLDDVTHATPGSQPPVASPWNVETLGWGRVKSAYYLP